MGCKDLLVHVDAMPQSARAVAAAVDLACRFAARVTGIHVIPEPEVPPYFKPSVAQRVAAIYADQAKAAAGEAEAAFRAATAGAGVPEVGWRSADGDVAAVLALHARTADLLIVGQSIGEGPRSVKPMLAAHRIALVGGAPTLVVPAGPETAAVGRRILVAWDGSAEAARAVRDALPILAAADHVAVAWIAERDDRAGTGWADADCLADHLRRHGIDPEIRRRWPDTGAAAALRRLADEDGTDLIVMGAFGHPWPLEFAFGGATYDLLAQTTVPLLLSR